MPADNSGKRAIFIASQKGGAGKSTFARALLDQLRAEKLTTAAFDADGNVGQLLQYAGSRSDKGVLLREQDPFEGCGFFDIYAEDDRDGIVNALAIQADRLLFDLPGGAVTQLCQILDEGDTSDGLVNEYRRADYRLTVVVVMTPVLAGVRTVQSTIHLFGANVDYIAVRNLAFGDEDAFILFDGVDDERVPLADRARVRQWIERFKLEIEPARKGRVRRHRLFARPRLPY